MQALRHDLAAAFELCLDAPALHLIDGVTGSHAHNVGHGVGGCQVGLVELVLVAVLE